MSTTSYLSPLPSVVHSSARIRIRSITPRKSASTPHGSWTTSGVAPRRLEIISTQRWNSAPTRSILLTKQIRGHVVLVGLPPDRLRLRLHAGHRVEHRDRAVKHPKRALHFDGEVDVARRVDDVDRVVQPGGSRRGGRDRDAALLLLRHPVHGGRAIVDFTDLVVDAG